MSRTDPVERFRAKVDSSGGPDACWPWTGRLVKENYGDLKYMGRRVRAHRLAWELANGPIPDGAHIDHICHNGTECAGGPTCPHHRCCNPAHLEPTTSADNQDRSHLAPQHRTHCPQGHLYDEANTYYARPKQPSHRWYRACRACGRERTRLRDERRRNSRT